ncbi:thiopeptide-type bacteriocin biosynthesis protein [Kitasatospora sp. NPDC002227]|uniref:thiopeptide-type bacteriocin biosynthesis protein n=1 Tax=Kitasatospora sp. NPDC002227 TaxID=3154773 RepID=UPI00332DF0C5
MSTTTIAPEWESLHVFAHGDRSTADHLYLAAAEEGRRAVGAGLASGWFALRYWEGGPHIRLRLRDTAPGLADEVAQRLAVRAGTLPGTEPFPAFPLQNGGFRPGNRRTAEAIGWQPTGTVLRPGYRPETARYGGPEAMPLGEDMFQYSSELAAEALPAVLAGASRAGTALALLAGQVAGLLDAGFDETTVGTSLRRYALASAARPGAPRVDVPAARARAAHEYEQQPEQFRAAVARLRAAAQRSAGPAVGLPGRWAAAVHDYARRLQALGGDPWPALTGQWHMLANRLGSSVADESFLTWLAGLTLSGRLLGPDGTEPTPHPGARTARATGEFLHAVKAHRESLTQRAHLAARARRAAEPTEHAPAEHGHAEPAAAENPAVERTAAERSAAEHSAPEHEHEHEPAGRESGEAARGHAEPADRRRGPRGLVPVEALEEAGESDPTWPSGGYRTPAPLYAVPRPGHHTAAPQGGPVPLPAVDAALAVSALPELLGLLDRPAARPEACGGEFDAARLATLLGLAAGVVPPASAPGPGRSAAAPHPLLLDVVVRRVAGLPAGSYRYLPAEHALSPRPAVDTAALLSTSPYAAPRPAWHRPTVAEEAPVLLLLGTAPGVSTLRYGPRGARSALLEAGRLTQSLLLTATALGLRAVTVCGGYDELALASGGGGLPTQPLCLVAVGAES